jgi:putative solute:sodium symporter small subunit
VAALATLQPLGRRSAQPVARSPGLKRADRLWVAGRILRDLAGGFGRGAVRSRQVESGLEEPLWLAMRDSCVRFSVRHFRHFAGRKKMNHDSEGYWKATLGLLTKVLIVWFLVSFGAGILFADMLNSIHLGGYPLGFWFAQQGSMYIFIALIFYYKWRMDSIDREFDVHED